MNVLPFAPVNATIDRAPVHLAQALPSEEDVEGLHPGLAGGELQRLAAYGVPKTYARDSVVITEGDDALAMYVVMAGKVKVYTTTQDGREIILRFLEPGGYFGELSMLDGAQRSASVKVTETSQLLVVSRNRFAACLAAHPELFRVFVRDLSLRVRQVSDDLARLASLDVYQRLTRLLGDLAVRQGDGWVVPLRMTQQELADRICASREMVSRVLQTLVAGGYIILKRRQIVIRKKLPERW